MTASTHTDPIATLAERQTWITPQASHAAQDAIKRSFEALGPQAQTVRNALHGTWLHEPLHAVLTDLPLGSWTAAILFDAIGSISGNRAMDKAADATVLFGLVTAAGAAVTGLNDWAEIRKDTPRRVGAVHALLNIGATALFTASCFARRSRRTRSTARALAAIGYVVVSASAHLGGNLVYEHGIGVREQQTRGKGSAESHDDPSHPQTTTAPDDRGRDPEDWPVSGERAQREKNLDKTLADSFPTSDPPSSIPDPA